MIDYREKAETAILKHLITNVYPKGIISYVADTYDFWRVITVCAPKLKEIILARDGKVVFRPDSGDPVKIICGFVPSSDPWEEGRNRKDWAAASPAEWKGAIECLWDIFGGSITSTGHKLLHPSVGLIYGDSITPERAKAILAGLEAKGFASANVVFGIGSFTYQHVTRDTYGFAVKSTYGEVNGEGRMIFKDPKTDNGTKKSARGMLVVQEIAGELTMIDGLFSGNISDYPSLLQPVFKDGHLLVDQTLTDIRALVAK